MECNRRDTGAARPLACVVTPVYNGAAHLENAAFPSVRKQSYRPLVHIIQDNASTDATAEQIARYASEVDYPVIVRRNPVTVRQAQNFNAAVEHVPADVAYFTVLCADDMMTPDALEEMMAMAAANPGLVMIGARESVNETLRPAYLPESATVFDASNMCARILEDDARPPFPHVLIRRDVLRAGEKAFAEDYITHDAEFVLRVLAQGGSFGFVHRRLFNNLHHAGAITFSVAKKTPYIWERFLYIERFGPSTLTNSAYQRLRRRHLRIVYRRLLYWLFTGSRENLARELPRFRSRGAAPDFLGYLDAVLSWPGHVFEQRLLKPHDVFTWPEDAYRRDLAETGKVPAPAEWVVATRA